MKELILGGLLAITLSAGAQTLTLQDCYTLAKQNYPLAKQHDLIKKSGAYSVENIATGYLPQININGQATYQSEVTQVPIKVPGIDIPTISKDQYKLYGEVTQVLYDGGVIKQQKKLQDANTTLEEQSLEVELYKLNDRINQLYFGILLVDEQLKQTALTKADIQNTLKKTEAAIANGTALKSNADVLKAEILKIDQKAVELKAMRSAYGDMLSLFINGPVNETTQLQKPEPLLSTNEINRPELALYEKQAKLFDAQEKMIGAKNLPKLGLFVQGGVGKPALNMLSNQFEGYYLGGVRLNWSLSGFYTAKKERYILDIKKKNTDIQKETFLYNTNMVVKQQKTEADKWNALLQTDDDIITLRTSVKTTAAAQLENGVITGSDYIREVNAEDQAKQNRILHEIQLLQTQYNLKYTTSN
ncbi:MAG: TolC family protein [Agriterribacter sp.]